MASNNKGIIESAKEAAEMTGIKMPDIPGMPEIQKKPKAPELIKSEEYGNRTSKTFDTAKDGELKSLDIKSVIFRSGDIFDGIDVVYADGTRISSGGSSGKANVLELENGDSIEKLWGYCEYGYFGHITFTDVYAETVNGKKAGPFGSRKGGKPFSIEASGKKIAGFCGSIGSSYLSSLGAYFIKK